MLTPLPLPPGLTERQITSSASELSYHIIEAGKKGNPLVLLVHGFPEIAYSWRKVMPGLSKAGFYTVAVDQRGYGRTTGWDNSDFKDVKLETFSMTVLIRDLVILVHALSYRQVGCIVGHDFGSVTASLCALARPDLFRRVVLMSHPFNGSPKLPFDVSESGSTEPHHSVDIQRDLASLPNPRKHYKWYYSTAAANTEMRPPEGLHDFLRGYFHLKSADWSGNNPYPLTSWTATELAQIPYYYVMRLDSGMRETVADDMRKEDPKLVQEKSSKWFSDSELNVYVEEFSRTGFQGGLNWYRVQTDPANMRDLDIFAGKKIEVPCFFISGTKDWGTYQQPGAIENMNETCSDFHGVKLIDGAGHWVQQEQPEEVVHEILGFFSETKLEAGTKDS